MKRLILATLALASSSAFAQYVPNYTYIEAGYARASSDTSLGDLNGAAFRGSANFGNFNFIAGMTRFNVDNNPFVDHIRATFAGFGYRWEGSIGIAYAKINNVDSNTALDLQAQFFLTDKIGVVGGAAIGNNENTYTVGLRYTP